MFLLIDNYDSFTYNLYHYLLELGANVEVYRNDQITTSEIAAKKYQGIIISPGPATPDDAGICLKVIAGFSTLDDFSSENIEVLFKKIVEEEGIKLGKLAQPVRVALTGTTVSPGIYDVVLLLGKEETIKRLENCLKT